jgi:uncharacterized protein (TIGR03083 family)
MTDQYTWKPIHAERAALASDLAPLGTSDWLTPSLCTGLSVREVLAHQTAGASLTPLRWFAGVIRCRFDFDRQVAMRLAEHMGANGAETLDRFRAVVDSTTKPLMPVLAMLGEAVVHGEDIRRPLGIRREYPTDTLMRVAEYYCRSNLPVLAKGRIDGLRLEATDGPFRAGEGQLVTGPTLALIMAMTGRGAYLEQLSGAGAPALGGRRNQTNERRKAT